MADFIEVVGLEPVLMSAGITTSESDIETLYQELSGSPAHAQSVSQIESQVAAYFELIKIPDDVTLYDQLLLSLREKDVVATFNWDPLLLQSYRRNVGVRRLPKILFLHGSISVGICLDCRTKGCLHLRCSKCGRHFQPTRLLYPIKEKDYISDPFIAGEWDELKRNLERAYIVTIIGYRAPSTDAAAVDLLRQVWDRNETRELAQVEVVDIRSEREVFQTWEPFIVREHYHITSSIHTTILGRYPRRSCDAFAWATLQNSPWPVNEMPSFGTLRELQNWVQPLLEEEIALDERKRAFSGRKTEDIRQMPM